MVSPTFASPISPASSLGLRSISAHKPYVPVYGCSTTRLRGVSEGNLLVMVVACHQSPSGRGRNGLSLDEFNKGVNHCARTLMLTFLTSVGVLRRHDNVALWGLLGAVINHLSSRSLKRIIKQPRPGVEAKTSEDLGMPSTHAQNLGFLSVYAASGGFLGGFDWSITCWMRSFFILFAASYMAWLRVREGQHTAVQVLVGGLVGSTSAAMWLSLQRAVFQ